MYSLSLSSSSYEVSLFVKIDHDFRHLEIVEEFFMRPIKEGRIGGSTSSNAFTHTDYVKVSEKDKNEVGEFSNELIFRRYLETSPPSSRLTRSSSTR